MLGFSYFFAVFIVLVGVVWTYSTAFIVPLDGYDQIFFFFFVNLYNEEKCEILKTIITLVNMTLSLNHVQNHCRTICLLSSWLIIGFLKTI